MFQYVRYRLCWSSYWRFISWLRLERIASKISKGLLSWTVGLNYSSDHVVKLFKTLAPNSNEIYESVFIITVADRLLSSPQIRSVSIWCANHISFDQTKEQFPSQWIRVKGGGDGIVKFQLRKKILAGWKKSKGDDNYLGVQVEAVTQLAGWSPPEPEIRGSNLVINELFVNCHFLKNTKIHENEPYPKLPIEVDLTRPVATLSKRRVWEDV